MNSRSIAFRTISSWPTHDAAGNRTGFASVGAEAETDEWAQWAGAVNRMAGGDYADAWPHFVDLAASDDIDVAGLSSAARASGLRQLGSHAEAVDHDDRAISTGGVALLDGLIGRAADEIGLGNPDRCRHYLARADRTLAMVPEQQLRGHTRIGWVAAEVALMQGQDAVAPANRAVASAKLMGSPRHILKSMLIRGVATRSAGDPAGDAELVEVLRSAVALGIRTLVWPTALALEDDLPSDLRGRSGAAVAFIRSHMPPGRFDDWVAATGRLDMSR